MRIFLAFRAFFRVLLDVAFARDVERLAAGGPAALPRPEPAAGPPPEAPRAAGSAREQPSLMILALLQREGRLVDFLREDIQDLDDAQIGAAVREIHKGCRRVIAEQLTLEPVRREPEGSVVEVGPGFDPSAIRLVGNVHGQPPFKGVLRHHGWQVAEVRLPPLPSGHDPRIVAPAEVEVR